MTGVIPVDKSEAARAAFEEMVRDNEERILRYAAEMTGSVEDARDMVQTCLLKAWNVYKEGARPDNARAWLYRITHNEIANLLRSKRIRREVHQSIVLQIPQDKDAAVLHMLASESFLAVQRLDEPYKEAISLHYFHGLSLQETAGVLGCPIGTAKTYVARGLQTLRKMLGGKLDKEKE